MLICREEKKPTTTWENIVTYRKILDLFFSSCCFVVRERHSTILHIIIKMLEKCTRYKTDVNKSAMKNCLYEMK